MITIVLRFVGIDLQMKRWAVAFTLLVGLAGSTFAAQKPDPVGIIRFFSTYVSKPENDPSWNNSNLDGVRLRPIWTDIQSTAGSYDWSSIDPLFDLAAQHGKTAGLSVGAGVSTPQWVYNLGATKYKLQDGSGLSMSLPWDPTFLAQWAAFVKAMGARYDGNPALGYVVMSGMGQNIETYLSKSAADDIALGKLGGATAWENAAKQIIDLYAEAFPTTPFFITAAKPFDSDEGISALVDLVDWGVATYPGRFGIMNASLNANSNTGYYPNLAVSTYSPTQPVGLQMLCSATLDPVRLGGTLDQALTQAVLLGAKFVEIYQSDADNSKFQAVLADQGTALEGNAGPHAPQNLRIIE